MKVARVLRVADPSRTRRVFDIFFMTTSNQLQEKNLHAMLVIIGDYIQSILILYFL